jgi:glycosyltransferase involved in cell wall biosynthesis
MRVALISTVPPGERGSMGLYGGMVLEALRAYAPGVQAVPVALRSSTPVAARGLAGQLALLGEIRSARQAASRVQADVCHLLDGSYGYMATRLPMPRTLVTLHDLIPALQARGRFPVPPPGWAARRLIDSSLAVLKRAGAVHTVSACTACDLKALTGRAADAVIPNPLRQWSQAWGAPAAPSAPGSEPFVLHVGNNGFYKNREGVLRIFAAMVQRRPDLRLAMAGPAPTGAMVAKASQLRIADRVDWVVNPRDEDLQSLYRRAAVLLFPSLYEGFGWPPLEAMSLGTPSVCADAGSLPEVVGDAALVWSPSDTEGFATQALRLLDDAALVRQLRERGTQHLHRFSLQRLAEGLVPLYERLARGKT